LRPRSLIRVSGPIFLDFGLTFQDDMKRATGCYSKALP
jgi:hypothetical protein